MKIQKQVLKVQFNRLAWVTITKTLPDPIDPHVQVVLTIAERNPKGAKRLFGIWLASRPRHAIKYWEKRHA